MRLTTYTDYTLRTLMYLAICRDRSATIAEIAGAYDISEAHLMKVVHQLGMANDVATQRGRRGGIRLAREPESINLGATVRRTVLDRYSLADLVAPRQALVSMLGLPPRSAIRSLV
jgi:Rrf2 family transcriptional regulator, nitric oxide-sensitive transcriptional repressor